MAAPLNMDRTYFEKMYAGSPDPWDFESSPYERRKFALTLAALPRDHYKRAFEPGCANGALSELLVERCGALVCAEFMPEVAARARWRLAGSDRAQVYQKSIPDWWPTGSFDLIVMSEILYYLTPSGMQKTLPLLERSLLPGGHVVSVHYALPTNYPQSGAEVADCLRRASWLHEIGRYSERAFELLVLEKRP